MVFGLNLGTFLLAMFDGVVYAQMEGFLGGLEVICAHG